jgi:hypothetical protein
MYQSIRILHVSYARLYFYFTTCMKYNKLYYHVCGTYRYLVHRVQDSGTESLKYK